VPAPPADVDPCERTLPTEPPTGDPTARPPTVETLAPNTTWLDNVRSVTGETLGSSDGSQSQTFAVTSPPVVDETVWVDEAATLSAGGRQSLEAAETPPTEAVTTPDGQLQSFWVAWTQVSDFLDSGEDERHYTVDRVEGQITFGDGVAGRIPPRGENNVRIDYRTGGGTDGNVASGAVAGLKSSLQFVDSVANPAPGTGGADAESTDRVLTRAPRELRDRDRAVTEADYERVALDAARKVSRAACIPEMNRYGESAPGWVTLIIVPNSPSTTPTPSTGLKAQVEAAVSDRAPATLVAADRLVVRGPSYVAVSVEVTLTAVSSGSVATLEESVTDAIAAFLHPLSGGPMDDRAGDEGWPFGELPTLSDLYALIEGVEGVDYVEQLAVQYDPDTNETTATVTEGEEPPRVSPDALVHSGVHDVTVRLESDPGDDRTSEGS
jgi:predicted phage baseplate assembly protein